MTGAELEQAFHGWRREVLERRRSRAAGRRRGWVVRRALAVADALGLTLAFGLALWVFGTDATSGAPDQIDRQVEGLLFLATLPGWIVVAKLYGLYDRDEERTDHSTADEFAGVFHMITVGSWLLFAGAWLTGLAHPQLDKLVAFWALAIPLVCLFRAAARSWCRRQVAYIQNTIIVGACDVGRAIARKYLRHPEYGVNLVGFVDVGSSSERPDVEHLTFLGAPSELPQLIGTFDVDRVVFAFPSNRDPELLGLVRQLQELSVQVDIVPRLHEVVGPRADVHTVEGVPVLGLPPANLSRSSAALKRGFDIVVATVALALLLPFLLLIAVAIKVESRGPVFFRQVRMGRADRTFLMLKFRSMAADAEAVKPSLAHLNMHAQPGGDPRMFKVPNDPRVTRVGRVLRRFSLDELPQLVNVLAGDMSLVGPRPLILDEDCEVREWARHRLDLKPGITGLWQVLGNSGIAFDEMVALDYLYVTSWSLYGDLKLLARTLPVIVRSREAY